MITKMIDEGIRRFDLPPNLIVRLVEEFYDNKEFRYELIHSFDKGVKMFSPGRSAGVPHSYIKILENWREGITSQKFLNWINDAIDYFNKQKYMENPPEFIHYKVPHFTPLHISFLNIMKKTVRVGKIVF